MSYNGVVVNMKDKIISMKGEKIFMKRQNLLKKAAALLLAGAMMAGSAMTTLATAGQWKQDAVGWWWERNGRYPTNAWVWIDGNNDGSAECYYFDGNGYMLSNTITPDGCTVNADGAWTVNGVVQVQATNSDIHDVGMENMVSAASTAGAVTDGKSWPQITFDETLLRASSERNGLNLLPSRTQTEPLYPYQDDYGPVCSLNYKGKTITFGTSTTSNTVGEYFGPVSAFFNNFPEQGMELNAFYDNTGYDLYTGRQPRGSSGQSDAHFKLPQGSYRMAWGTVDVNAYAGIDEAARLLTYRDFQILLTAGEDGKWYIYPDSPMHVN